jgi:hypothetical protein
VTIGKCRISELIFRFRHKTCHLEGTAVVRTLAAIIFLRSQAMDSDVRLRAARQQRCPVGDSGGIFRIRGADR